MCIHYIRNIKVKCNQCNIFYDCHKCHDIDSDHIFTRTELKLIKCNLCNLEQIPSTDNMCIYCKNKYSDYFCLKCSYFGENETIHCDICGVCRFKLNYEHKCIPNILLENCSICLLNISLKKYIIINCTHVFHTDCLFEYVKTCETPTCPLCRQSFGNKNIFCTYCKQSFYGLPKGTKLNCGHFYHKNCLKNLQFTQENNKLTSIKCSDTKCNFQHLM